MTAKIEVYKDTAGEYRWSLVAGNNEIVAQGEGHTREEDATRAAIRAAELLEEAVDSGFHRAWQQPHRMKRPPHVRIRSGPTFMTTSVVVVQDDGTEVPLHCRAAAWSMQAGEMCRVTLDLDDVEVDIEGELDLPEPDPNPMPRFSLWRWLRS